MAEYILSTLATYFLGDSIFQWIIIISLMLFSMGLGSRLSKFLNRELLLKFLFVELALSLLVSFSPLIVYSLSAFTLLYEAMIYVLAIFIGILIGMELPLVMRINEEYESLKFNVSNIMENDYYGSLLGGIFFAFVGLPFFGIMYTPFVLGFVNLTVAIAVFLTSADALSKAQKRSLSLSASGIAVLIAGAIFLTKPIILFGEQKKYKDKVVYSEQSRYQRIVITEWKGDHWLYLNGNQQLCSRDEAMYHEPLVHPAMRLNPHPTHVLILGGGDGCAAREVLKYESVAAIDLVDLDPAVTELARAHPALTRLNKNALDHKKVNVFHADGYKYLDSCNDFYDVIIVDLPDPKTVDLSRLYSREFYLLAKKRLRPGGVLVTQAGSPYFATRAFLCIEKTMEAAGFSTVPFHNQVITLGEWGWILGQKSSKKLDMKERMLHLDFSDIRTQWINEEALFLMTSFGKHDYLWTRDTVEVNQIHDPVLYRYYQKGNWDLY